MSCILLSALALVTASGATPSPQVLQSRHPVQDVTTGEFTHDGINDILIFSVDEESDPPVKFLSVYAGNAQGTYGPDPSTIVRIPWKYGVAFHAQTDESPAREIVLANHDGFRVLLWADSTFQYGPEIEVTTLLPSGTHEPLFLREVITDLDGDGIDEWLLPASEGYIIAGPGGVIARLDADLSSEALSFGRLQILHKFAIVGTYPQSELSNLGVALLTDRKVEFYGGADWSERQTFAIPLEFKDKWDATAEMKDINGDGFPDIVVSQIQGTINMQVETSVFFAKAAATYSDEPDAFFFSKGAFTIPGLYDVNGDEKLDLIFLGISFGFRNIVNYFIRGKVGVDIDLHLFQDGSFPESGNDSVRLAVDAPDGQENIAYVLGDFNGDKRGDAIVAVKEDELALFEGSEEKVMNTKPAMVFEVPAFGVARRADLNSNERDDVIIFHRQSDLANRVEVLVF